MNKAPQTSGPVNHNENTACAPPASPHGSRQLYAAKALVAVTVPIITKFLVDVIDVVSIDAENFVAVIAGAIAVYLTPNKAL